MRNKRPPINREYSNKLKAIRGYVDFDYDLRKPLHANSKRKIDRYFNAIDAIQARPNKVYRSKNKKRVKSVQEFGRNGFENLPGIKVAFYESSAANPITIRFDKKGLKASGKYFDIRYIPFNLPRLLRNADKEIHRALSDPGTRGADWFRVAVGQDGQYSIASPRKRANVASFINQLMNKYVKHDDSGKELNNYWGNWLHGLLPMTAKNQTELREFLVKESKIKDTIRQRRKRTKRNEKNKRMRQRNRSL